MTARTLSRVSVVGFWSYFVALAVLDRWLPPEIRDSFEYFAGSSFLSVAIIVTWVESDASHRGYRVRMALRLLVIGLALIGVPLFVIRSRGWRGFFRFAGRFLACLAGALLFANGLWVIGLL